MRYFPAPDPGRTRNTILLVFTCLAASCGGGKLSKQDIRISASDLRSLANASALLLEQAQSGSTTSIFLHAQSKLLAEKVESVSEGLDGVGGDNDVERSRLRELASALATDIQSGSPDAAGHIKSLSSDILTIEEKLKE